MQVIERRDGSLPYIVAGILGIVIAFVTLHLWHADLTLPLYYAYGGDGLAQAAIAKNFAEHGSINWFPHLAAPIGGILVDFPTLSVLHLTMERVLIALTGNSNIALNLIFLLAFPLTTMTALFALRRMGAMMTFAFPIAGLYTALPARFERNEGHLFYATYWVLPLAVILCVLIARGDEIFFVRTSNRPKPTRLGWFAVAIAVLIGADNQYHAFFTIALLLVAAIVGYVRSRVFAPVIVACVCSFLIGATLVAQLVPAFVYDAQHGKNAMAFERYPEESVTYGLHIAELLLPVAGHRVARLANARAYYDSRTGLGNNESSWSSFGFAGALGFLLLIGALLVRPAMRLPRDLDSLATLNLAGVLVATVGGFGTLFNFFVRPEIRAYNRISTLLAFLALAAVALTATELTRRSGRMMPRAVALPIMAAILVLGLFDQTTAGMIPPYAADAMLFSNDQVFVDRLSTAVPANAAIFELPWVRFPESAPAAQLDPENLYRPYLHSKTLRYSYGAVEGRSPEQWERTTSALPPQRMLESMILGGYEGIIVFRQGYSDGGAAIEASLQAWLGAPVASPDGNLAFYSLEPLRKRVGAISAAVLTPAYAQSDVQVVQTAFGDGFSIAERNSQQTWRWADNTARLALHNAGSQPRRMRFAGQLVLGTGRAPITIAVPGRSITIAGSTKPAPFDIMFDAPRGDSTVDITTSAAPLVVHGDTRRLVMQFINPVIEPADAATPAIDKIFATAPAPAVAARPVAATATASGGIRYVSGCDRIETNGAAHWIWCGPTSVLEVQSAHKTTAHLTATASTPGQPTSTLVVRTPGSTKTVALVPRGTPLAIDIDLLPGKPVDITLASNAVPLVAPGDARTLVLRLDNVSISNL